ncbi:MAG: hypothetical protein JNL97_02845, partial [Verrucomicrobiales bacterium]|nr:hypothetical protein [Verrucomicrobiales bacterium]
AVDDSRVEPTRTARFEVSADGTVGASATLSLTDNDLPSFTLTLSDTQVSESGGVAAAVATVSRGAASPRSLAVTVESSAPSLVRVPATTSIPAGQAFVSFPVEVIDDIDANGSRTATIRASALATASETVVATTAPVTITVTDDDGPALAIQAERDVLAEGVTEATFVVVSRNTPAASSLTVQLTSSAASEATVPPTAVIPAGSASVRVPVRTWDDDRVDGTQAVRIVASAAGYVSADVTLSVTDVPYADLIVSSLTGPESGETEAAINISYRVSNQGLAAAGTNWVTRVFLSSDANAGDDTLLVEYPFVGTLPVGQHFAQTRQIRLPSIPGDYWLVAVTDVSGQIPEVLENNNTRISSRPIAVQAAYRATVEATPESAPAGTPITLRGTATKTATGGPAPFVLVNLHLGLRDTLRVFSALTDELGRFSTVFRPLPGEAGIYEVGAAHPGAAAAPVQDTFVLLGMSADPTEPVRVHERSGVAASITLHNLGDAPLKGLQATVSNAPVGVRITPAVPAPGNLGPLGSISVGLTVAADDGSAGQGTAVIRLVSAEGASLDVPIAITVARDEPVLEARPVELLAGVRAGGQAIVSFDVVNSGGSTSEPIHVALPPNLPWIHVAGTVPLPTLAPGTTNRVTLQLRPDASVPLGETTGTLLLAAGSSTASVPFRFRVLSDATGDLRVTAVDEYTYYAEGAPKVAGAEVTVLDAVTEQIVRQGVTDATGELVFRQMPEGWYDVRVRADLHGGFRDTCLVVAGFETNVLALMPRQAVRYIWTVVPTEIEDRTRISIETVFEAFVPMPVVTIEPAVIDLADYGADVTQIDLRITNHGLVAAQKARIGFDEHPDWRLEPLIEELGTLPARSTLTIPLLIRRLNSGGSPFVANGKARA